MSSYTSDVLFFNGPIYTGEQTSTTAAAEQPQAVLCRNGRIVHVGSLEDVRQNARQAGHATPREVDLEGHLLMPAFIDSHVHVAMQGESLTKVDLDGCVNVTEIQQRLRAALEAQPGVKRLQAKRLVPGMVGHKPPRRQDLDAVSPDGIVAIYVESRDLHSSWLSTAALAEAGIDASTPDPAGGKIHRDGDTGLPSGFLEESAHFTHVWPTVSRLLTHQDRIDAIQRSIDCFLEQGVTTVVDMAMEESILACLRTIVDRHKAALEASSDAAPRFLRIACHWLVQPKDNEQDDLVQVQRAKEIQAELKEQGYDPWLRIAGIKLIGDGVIDSCTASLHQPYHDGSVAKPIWPLEKLKPVCRLADELDLQIAIHAIGDKAVDEALDALEYAADTNGLKRDRRHRIEHLELTRAESVPRLAKLGVTASVQAVHASPVAQDNWIAMLGGKDNDRCSRAFAYGDFLAHGALVALGTDAPTTPNTALENLYVAQTRKAPEAKHSHLPATTPQWALPFLASLQAATLNSAVACKSEDVLGSIAAGKSADFAVLDVDIVARNGGESLIKAKVMQTWIAGMRVV
ncbi:unnamed protein product [Parajaminaea phylloscopi]